MKLDSGLTLKQRRKTRDLRTVSFSHSWEKLSLFQPDRRDRDLGFWPTLCALNDPNLQTETLLKSWRLPILKENEFLRNETRDETNFDGRIQTIFQ
jgi:hypothetical protein